MSIDRFWDEWTIEGIAFSLAASKDGCTGGYYHYTLDLAGDTFEHRKKMRAYRLERIGRGKKPPKLLESTLQDEFLILFGPDISPQDAITSLTKVINHIERHGLLVGRNRRDDDIRERPNGNLENAG